MAAATDLAISARRPQIITGIALVAMIRTGGDVCGGGCDWSVDMKVPRLADIESTREFMHLLQSDVSGG